MKNYDVTVIGSGPGGYVCAIRCAQLGMKTAIIEKYKTLGGTCLNVGCIPSKALLDSSEHYHQAKEKFSAHGILVDNLRIDLKKMIERKNEVVSQTCAGVDYLMKKNKIDVYCGTGFFENKNTISIRKEDDSVEKISTKNAVIATGSKPTVLPFIPVDKERIITSTEALNLQEVPKHMILIGGGVIGTELGSVYARLGAKVSVVELLDRIVPPFDKVMSKELQKSLKKMGMEFYLKHKVTKVERDGDNVKVYADKDGKEVILEGDYCLVAIGRSPYTKGLNLEEIGVATEKGRIAVNDHLQTSIDNIYAIGDVIDGPMLAHKAEEEGIFVAELLDGQKPHINHLTIPNVVYTWPEVASVGYTEEQVKEQNRAYNVGSFPFKASGRARASMDLEGLVKVICDKETDEILGIHIIGPRAADMIAEGVLAMEYKASAEDIARICHAHPTFTEAFKEAALAATGNRALHI